MPGRDMIINYFHPGMIVEIHFLMPGARIRKPRIRLCVVMSVHVKGLLVHPLMPRGSSTEKHAVYTKHGRIACDLRNIIEAPVSYAVVQTMKAGMPGFAKASLDDAEFKSVREMSLEVAYDGITKSERLRGDAAPVAGRRRLA